LGRSINNYAWFAYGLWCVVFVQQVVAKFAEGFMEFPPIHIPASFNLEALKEQVTRHIITQPPEAASGMKEGESQLVQREAATKMSPG
jgi:hypothetical protein